MGFASLMQLEMRGLDRIQHSEPRYRFLSTQMFIVIKSDVILIIEIIPLDSLL